MEFATMHQIKSSISAVVLTFTVLQLSFTHLLLLYLWPQAKNHLVILMIDAN